MAAILKQMKYVLNDDHRPAAAASWIGPWLVLDYRLLMAPAASIV